MQRREAREFVLSALYQREFTEAEIPVLLEEVEPGDQSEYIESTFRGILDRRPEIDAMIGERTVGWRFERLALIDRNILRIGVYELLHGDDIPPEVAMDEAVELAKKFGTEQARSFINGILDRIWKDAKNPVEDADARPDDTA
ncbi:transcription antitermination factor NusB [Candidatus Bipolaricaulota bacterium]